MQQWYVYLMHCADDTLYCGITTNVQRRLQEHNGLKKGGAKYTKVRRPVQLAAFAPVATRSEAAKLEASIKKLPKVQKISALQDLYIAAQQPVLSCEATSPS